MTSSKFAFSSVFLLALILSCTSPSSTLNNGQLPPRSTYFDSNDDKTKIVMSIANIYALEEKDFPKPPDHDFILVEMKPLPKDSWQSSSWPQAKTLAAEIWIVRRKGELQEWRVRKVQFPKGNISFLILNQ